MARSRDVMVIDLFGLSATSVRQDFPEVYQHLLETVKPERDRNNRVSYREKWFQFGEPRREMRPALEGISRYIATVETAKHRVFQFLDAPVMPDNKLVTVATDGAFHLGVMSSAVHVIWATRAGGWLGVGNDPVYAKSRCFDPFPFPDATTSLRSEIGELAEELDATRKLVLAENRDLTLTALYNILDTVRSGNILLSREREICSRGRVLIFKDLHEQIDRAVVRAYGWSELLTDDEIIEHLVDLNLQRASEERRGLIKWLRPEYQINKLGPLAHRADRIQSITSAPKLKSQSVFPKERKAQAGRVLELLTQTRSPLSANQIASRFKNSNLAEAEIQDVLESFQNLGYAETFDNGRSYIRTGS